VRSGAELVELIRNSLSTNAYFNQAGFLGSAKRKPVCLILDEIDGAFGGGSDQTKGINLVADFIKKCMKVSDEKKIKKVEKDEES
jgi:hypothetical protein